MLGLQTRLSSLAVSISCFAFVLLLAGCASSERPKPVPLGTNVSQMEVKTLWTNAIGEIGFPLEVQVVGKQVFVASGSGIVAAIDSVTGADVWRTNLATPLGAGVGSDGQISAVVSKENVLIVLDGSKPIWRHRLAASTHTAPFVAGGRVFTLSADRSINAFDALTGRKLWTQQRAGDALVLAQPGLLLAVGDTLVAGLAGKLVGTNPLNGAIRWESVVASARGTNEIERLVDVVSGYTRMGDKVCVRAFQYAVACVDAITGRGVWSKAANGSTGLTGNSEIVAGTEADGRVVAWRRLNGERMWAIDHLRFRALSTPLLLGRAIVVGDDSGLLHFLSKDDGNALNRIALDGSGISVAPALAQQTLVVITRKGVVHGLRAD